jgi:hypothetical protein
MKELDNYITNKVHKMKEDKVNAVIYVRGETKGDNITICASIRGQGDTLLNTITTAMGQDESFARLIITCASTFLNEAKSIESN